MAKSIVVFCAHNDDQIIGAGGTLINYAQKGMKIYTVIFSYGEKSHFWLKGEVTTDMRLKEAEEADKVMGGRELLYLGLKEGKFYEQFDEKQRKKLAVLLKEVKPIKIFTHSSSDPHPDHKAVYHLVKQMLHDVKYKGTAYSFDVWNIINLRSKKNPRLVVDISDSFTTKIKAFKCHRSQRSTFYSLVWNVYLKAFINGLKYGIKYAEVFHKIR